jgi:hypothetical protein
MAAVLACAGCAGAAGPARDATTVKTVKIEASPPSPPSSSSLSVPESPAGVAPPVCPCDPEADVARIAAAASEVARYLAEKRRAHDTVYALCLNDKLSQIHAAQRRAGEHRDGLRRALGQGDEGEALRERDRIALWRWRADWLVEQSRACV